MKKSKLKLAILASSLILGSSIYSQDTNSTPIKTQIEQNIYSLTNLAQNANGWRFEKRGDTKIYSTLQKDEFVVMKIKPSGLDMIGYVGNGKTIWDDNRDGFGLSSTTDAYEEYTRTNRTALYQNPSKENIERANKEYLSILENLNIKLDKTPKSYFGKFLDWLENIT